MDCNETEFIVVFQEMTNEGMSKQNPKNHTDLMWQTHMQTLTKRKRSMEIAQTIDKVLEEYYSEKENLYLNGELKRIPIGG